MISIQLSKLPFFITVALFCSTACGSVTLEEDHVTEAGLLSFIANAPAAAENADYAAEVGDLVTLRFEGNNLSDCQVLGDGVGAINGNEVEFIVPGPGGTISTYEVTCDGVDGQKFNDSLSVVSVEVNDFFSVDSHGEDDGRVPFGESVVLFWDVGGIVSCDLEEVSGKKIHVDQPKMGMFKVMVEGDQSYRLNCKNGDFTIQSEPLSIVSTVAITSFYGFDDNGTFTLRWKSEKSDATTTEPCRINDTVFANGDGVFVPPTRREGTRTTYTLKCEGDPAFAGENAKKSLTVYWGNLKAVDETDLNVLDGVNCVNGFINMSTADISNLSLLSSLQCIAGDFFLFFTSVSDISPIQQLAHVDGDIRFQGNDSLCEEAVLDFVDFLSNSGGLTGTSLVLSNLATCE